MSLSFVSKAVLTAKEGGDGYEEKPIENSDNGDTGRNSSSYTTAKPLFEQLRANKEQEEMEREEYQKSIMRGTLALDEEDCAHLDALQKQRHDRDREIQQQTHSELEAFRAAQAVNRMVMKHDEDEDEVNDKQDGKPPANSQKSKQPPKKPLVPKIIVKKRKKKPTNESKNNNITNDEGTKKQKHTETSRKEDVKVENEKGKPALGGLLAMYGSDSDSD